MLNKAAKYAMYAIAGTLIVGGTIIGPKAENAYSSTAVAGITLSVNEYVESIEAETPTVAVTSSGDATQDSGKYAKFVTANVDDALNVRKTKKKDSEVIGQMYKGDKGTLLKKGKSRSKIKSGKVVGWVSNDFLLFGDEAKAFADTVCTKTAIVHTETLNVRQKKSTDSEIVTLIPEGGEYDVTKEYKDGWLKISIDGDLKGYVSADYVDVKREYGKALTMKQVQKANEEILAAEQAAAAANVAITTETVKETSSESVSSIKPTQKAAAIKKAVNDSGTSFTNNSSVSSASTSTSGLGSQIASYALQFVGNPYRYGGTSLTNGADCSGFTQSVYAHFGYGLSRTAASQSGNGTSVSLSNLQPGDLLFYNNGGGIGHVALYIGNGMVVHASNRKDGIKTSVYNYRTPCKAVRVVR